MSFYPIFADPASFTGLAVSLAGGSITAEIGGDNLNIDATNLTANGITATWTSILAGGGATSNLQGVLDTENSAVAVNIVLTDADPATATTTMSSGGLSVSANTGLTTLDINSLTIVETDNFDITLDTNGFAYNSYVDPALPEVLTLNTQNLDMASGSGNLDTVSLSAANGLTGTDTTNAQNYSINSGGLLLNTSISQVGLSGTQGFFATDTSDPANELITNVTPNGFSMSSGEPGVSLVSFNLDTTGLTVNADPATGAGYAHLQTEINGTDGVVSYAVSSTGLLITDTTDPAAPTTVDVNPFGFSLVSGVDGFDFMTLSTTALNVATDLGGTFNIGQEGMSGSSTATGNAYSLISNMGSGIGGLSIQDVSSLPAINNMSLNSTTLSMETTVDTVPQTVSLTASALRLSEGTFGVSGSQSTELTPNSLLFRGDTTISTDAGVVGQGTINLNSIKDLNLNTGAGYNMILTAQDSMIINAGGNLVLNPANGNNGDITFLSSGVVSQLAGPLSPDYLVISINGTVYRIALLAAPLPDPIGVLTYALSGPETGGVYYYQNDTPLPQIVSNENAEFAITFDVASVTGDVLFYIYSYDDPDGLVNETIVNFYGPLTVTDWNVPQAIDETKYYRFRFELADSASVVVVNNFFITSSLQWASETIVVPP